MPKDNGNGVFCAIAGELEPTCHITNRILAAMCPEEEKKIVITGMPYGTGIPEEIRNGWIGVVINRARGPFTTGVKSAVNGDSENVILTEGYAVDTLTALESLKKVSAKSWRWFLNKKLPEYLFFNKECCKML